MGLGVLGRRDPWWDLEGRGARWARRRRQFVSLIAFALSIVATGFMTAVWFRLVEPAFVRVLG